jgi:superfamily II DNA or RNA helicase
MLPSKVYTPRGYSVEKSAFTPAEVEKIRKALVVTPRVPKSYAGAVRPFSVFLESASRFYLPVGWATREFGVTAPDIRSMGTPLPSSLTFKGTLRPHQLEALKAFREAGRNGIICLPCGYGKTFTGIAAATADREIVNTCFVIVVHKEFLADQWSEELKSLVPGIRIGRIQGERCDIGPDIDVAIAMIQTICSRNYPIGTFDRFGFAIFDEVHHLGAEHFSMALQRINCRRMLGLTATPKRSDGLSKVFEWHLGPIVYQIARRPKDDTVIVEALRYECDDPDYAETQTNYRGETIRARMINNIAEYTPRTSAVLEWVVPLMATPSRKLLVLSDRREHLIAFETGFKAAGIDSVGYYVGGMKQKDLDISATKRVILGTFAMASEGMNIPTLNMVLLATPKSNIEQSVGRILRQKKEERTVQPMILDIVDFGFTECVGQWNKRKKFYVECGYVLKWMGETEEMGAKAQSTEDDGDDTPKGVALFVEEDDEAPTNTVVMTAAAPDSTKSKKRATTSKKQSELEAVIEVYKSGKPLFIEDD